MIPVEIIKFLEEEATAACAGTRDSNFIPHLHKVSGWIISPDKQMISCSIPDRYTPHLISSLRDNGQIALTVVQVDTYKTYQFKGQYVDHTPCSDADQERFEKVRDNMGKISSGLFGMDEAICRTHVQKPALTVRFKVRDIFLQTPGPNAGERVETDQVNS